MSVLIQGNEIRAILFGTRVTTGAKTLPASTTGALFTVSGGRVLITSLQGVVTTAIQAQANAVKLVATPTVGAVNDMTGTVESNGLALGGIFSPTGLAGDALVKSTGGCASGLRNPIIVAAGSIGLNAAATNTGAVTWTLTYVALDDGASVAAV